MMNDDMCGVPMHIKQYLAFLKESKIYLGDVNKGEIEIVTDPGLIMKIEEENQNKHFTFKGLVGQTPSWKSGIIVMDKYFAFLRDPVMFPGKTVTTGLYDRLVYINGLLGSVGVAVLPVCDGKAVMPLVFRHATRKWCVEIPGTISVDGETVEESVRRCVFNELGAGTEIGTITKVGDIISERGILGNEVPIFAVEVKVISGRVQDTVTTGTTELSFSRYLELRKAGCLIRGCQSYVCKDAYTDTAMMLAHSAGIIK